MTYWLRFILTVSKAYFQKKLKWNDEVVQEFRVWFTEADMGIMNNARYFNFTELSKMRHFVGMGLFFNMIKLKWQPITSFQVIRYKRPLKRFQKFTLKSRIIFWDESYIFQLYTFERQNKLFASAIIKACFKGPNGVVKISEVIKELGLDKIPDAPPIPKAVADIYSAEKELLTMSVVLWLTIK